MSAMAARAAIAGLYAVTPDTHDTAALVRQVEAALAGGARVVQYRNKEAAPAMRLEQARALSKLCARHGRPLIVNDHVEIAVAADAAGVHVGAEDESLASARAALGPAGIVGVSCYDSLERAREACRAGADYVAFGSFFPSTVKPGAVRAGLDLLRAAKRELAVPVVAIGGITAENAPSLLDAGADAVAVISAVFAVNDVTGAARRFADLFEAAHDAQR